MNVLVVLSNAHHALSQMGRKLVYRSDPPVMRRKQKESRAQKEKEEEEMLYFFT